jgi:hypothetical protein
VVVPHPRGVVVAGGIGKHGGKIFLPLAPSSAMPRDVPGLVSNNSRTPLWRRTDPPCDWSYSTMHYSHTSPNFHAELVSEYVLLNSLSSVLGNTILLILLIMKKGSK